jgi:DNA-binding NarL/FixJ family response regulator
MAQSRTDRSGRSTRSGELATAKWSRGDGESHHHERGRSGPGPRLRAARAQPREAQVGALVTTGVANAVISDRLQLAPGTVRKHLDNVYGKLGAHERGPLTAFVLNISGRQRPAV